MALDPLPPRAPDCEARVRAQLLSWAMGNPYHEPVNDECCPDFSCCVPDLLTEETQRWRCYRDKYGPEIAGGC